MPPPLSAPPRTLPSQLHSPAVSMLPLQTPPLVQPPRASQPAQHLVQATLPGAGPPAKTAAAAGLAAKPAAGSKRLPSVSKRKLREEAAVLQELSIA